MKQNYPKNIFCVKIMQKIKPALFQYFFTLSFLALLNNPSYGQTANTWSGTTDGLMNTSTNWSPNATPANNNIISIDNNLNVTMTNDMTNLSRFKLTFGSNATSPRTISGSTENSFYDYSGVNPWIQNNAVNITHSISFPLRGPNNSKNFELQAMAGSLDISSTINTTNTTNSLLLVYGNNTAIDATNRWVRLSGVVSGGGGIKVDRFGLVKLNAIHTYTGQTTIDNGQLWVETTGDAISSGSAIYVGNGGQLTNVTKFYLSATSGGTNFTRNIVMNNGDASTRFLGSLNTLGTNTFSGTVTGTASNLNLEALNSGGITNFAGVISGSGALFSLGSGTTQLSAANTFSGTTTINSGNTLKLGISSTTNTSGPLGTSSAGTTVSSGAVLDMNGFSLTSAATEAVTLNGTGISNGGALVNNSGTTSTWSGTVILNSSCTVGGTGNLTLSGVISGANSLEKVDTGTLTLASASNSYSGPSTITGGTLQLGAAGVIPNASNMILNGGTFKTGITTGFSETIGTLTLSDNSTIALGTGNHTINFNASTAANWTAGKTLTITGWTGMITNSGTSGKIFVGSASTGLTADQLAQITFSGFGAAIILPTGEIVPSCTQATINTTGTVTAVCFETITQTATLTYTETTNTPVSYSIDWNAAANTAQLADQADTAFTFLPSGGVLNTIAIAAGALAGTYSGTMTITTASGCASTQAVSVTILETLTPGAISGTPIQCPSLTSQVYHIRTLTDATAYTWTVPTGWSITEGTGTNSITVTTGNLGQNGNITVTATNGCGIGSPQTLAVTIANSPPTISSPTSASITKTTATLGGNTTTIGCSNVTEQGIYYSVTNGFADGTGTKVSTSGSFTTGVFTQNVTGLTDGLIYYYKAFATNSAGTVYTTQGTFTTTYETTLPETDIFESYAFLKTSKTVSGVTTTTSDFYELDAAYGSAIAKGFKQDLGTFPPGTSYYLGAEMKTYKTTASTHKVCDCSSWYYIYKPTETAPEATDFPLPTDGTDFIDSSNGLFLKSATLADVTSSQTNLNAVQSTSNATYNSMLGTTSPIDSHIKKFQNQASSVDTEMIFPTCVGDFKVAIALLAKFSSTGDCTQTSSLYYKRDINEPKKINMSGTIVTLNPSHPTVETTDAVKNSQTDVFYTSSITIAGNSTPTHTWNGTSWSPATGFGIDSNLLFSANYTVGTNSSPGGTTAGFTVNSIQVADGVTVTIPDGKFIKVYNEGNTNISGKVIVANQANFVQSCNETGILSPNIELTKSTRAMNFLDYIYWGSPVQENIVSQLPSDFDRKYYWQSGPGGNWKKLTMTIPAQGFITRIRTAATKVPVTFKGTANNGIITIPVIKEDDNEDNPTNYALICNPYPCALDAKTFLSNAKNNFLGGTLYFWTSITPVDDIKYTPEDPYKYNYNPADYASWNLTGGIATAAKAVTDLIEDGSLIPTGKIASGQGFISEIKNNGDVYFDNGMRLTADVNTQFFKQVPKGPKTSKSKDSSKIETGPKLEEGRAWLNISNQSNFRQMLLGYVNGATNDYDERYDGKVYSDSPITIYSLLNDKGMSIQGRQLPFDEEEIIPLGYETSVEGEFYINIDQADGFLKNRSIYLEDKLLGTEHDLNQSAYIFSTGIGTFNDRFELKYSSKTLEINELKTETEAVFVSGSKNQIKINSTKEELETVSIYDISGRLILSKKNISKKELLLTNPTKQNGVLIVKVVLKNNEEITKKIIL